MADEQNSDILQFSSTRFGKLEVTKSSIIDVVGGIIGFGQFSKFVLIDYTPPFSWLHSTEESSLAFVVVNAAEFGENYAFALPIGDREIDLNSDDEVAVMNLVSVRPNPADITVNLKAPVVVNLRNRKARQIILDDSRYSTKFPLWTPESSEVKSEK